MLKIAKQKSMQRDSRPARDSVLASPANDAVSRRGMPSATLVLGLAGAVLLWAAFPPLNWPWVAWLAPVPWLWLVRWPQLSGWRPYLVLWAAGSIHWLLMLEGIRLAHPALYAGWIALSVYLGVYLPVFVGLTREAVHRLGVSIVVAAPVVWVGLELARGHLITGFSMGLLAHAQAEFPRLIQVADIAGGYGLSFVVMLVAACVARVSWGRVGWRTATSEKAQQELRPPKLNWWPVAPAAAAILVTLLYGQWRLSQTPPGTAGPTARVALIQGSLDTVFEEPSRERAQATFDHYRKITADAVHSRPNLDLVLWPESMLVVSETVIEEPLGEQRGLTADEARARLAAAQDDFR